MVLTNLYSSKKGAPTQAALTCEEVRPGSPQAPHHAPRGRAATPHRTSRPSIRPRAATRQQ